MASLTISFKSPVSSELKEPRLISDSRYPADLRFDYESPRNCGGTVSFDHFWSKVIGFIEHGGPLIFEHTHLCARRICLSTIYICSKLSTSFSWWGQSKRPHLNLCRDRCVLFGTGSCMAILSAQQSLTWTIELVNQIDDSWGLKPYADHFDPLSGVINLSTPFFGSLKFRHQTVSTV